MLVLFLSSLFALDVSYCETMLLVNFVYLSMYLPSYTCSISMHCVSFCWPEPYLLSQEWDCLVNKFSVLSTSNCCAVST